MQLKEAYQRIKKQQESPPIRKRGSLDQNSTIGSIHTGNINFSKDQTFFSNFKVRDEVKIAKSYINNLKDADFMQLKDKSWNASVAAPRKFEDYEKEETHKSKLLKIKLGFSDFSPIKEKPNKIYPGTQSRDDYKGWNVSTYFQQKQKKLGLQATNVNALQNTLKSISQKLPPTYKTLKQRYTDTNSLNKSTLVSNTEVLQDIKQSYVFTHPNASPERTNASTIRIFNDLQRQKLKQLWKQENEGSTQESFNTSFKANLSPTQRLKIRRFYFHTGKWQKSQINRENKKADLSDQQAESGYSWSCCLNQSKQSQGCSYRVEDGNKMNLASFST